MSASPVEGGEAMDGPCTGVKSAVASTVIVPPPVLCVVRSRYGIERLPVKLLNAVPVLVSGTLLGIVKNPPNGEMTADNVCVVVRVAASRRIGASRSAPQTTKGARRIIDRPTLSSGRLTQLTLRGLDKEVCRAAYANRSSAS